MKNASLHAQVALVVFGLASLTYGFYRAWPPLGFVAGGLILFMAGLLINKVSRDK